MDQQLSKRQEQIKPFLLSAQRQITSLLQDETKSKRFLAASLVVASDKSLNQCAPESIVQALVGVAMSDLNIDRNIGQCYLVPYGNQAQLQIGYKGFIQLLFRAGWMVKSFPVYHCDTFNMSFDGWNNKVEFTPDIDNTLLPGMQIRRMNIQLSLAKLLLKNYGLIHPIKKTKMRPRIFGQNGM